MQPLSSEELQAINERCERATPGPWSNPWEETEELLKDGIFAASGPGRSASVVVEADWWNGPVLCVKEPDASFIASARTDVPRLLYSLKQARKENEKLNQALDRTQTALQAQVDSLKATASSWISKCEALAKENNELRDALDTAMFFVQHGLLCPVPGINESGKPCDCGLAGLARDADRLLGDFNNTGPPLAKENPST